jgi:GT2 family glycosyltransferase
VRGLTLQRNAGIDISSRDLVFFLDDDAIPAPGYFRNIRNVFLAGANNGVGGVCGLVQTVGRRQMPRRWRIRFALGLVPKSEPLKVHPTATANPLSSLEPFEGTREVDYLPGCAFTFRREVLEADRFSEFFSGYSQGEDLEMSLRVGKSRKLLCCGDAPVTHLMVPGSRPRHFAKGKMDVINKHFLWKRHFPGAGIANTLRFWLDIGLIVLLDLASTVTGSKGTAGFAHAAGMTAGGWAVLMGASRYEEPPSKKQYALKSSFETA